MLTITLDWFAITHKEMTYEAREFIVGFASPQESTPERATNGYDSAYRTKDGVVHMWHSNREEMGWHTVFSGSALRNVFVENGISQRSFVESAVNSGGRISRLDLAKDAENERINLANIWPFIETKMYEGTSRNASKMQSIDGGYTIYVGSRQSEKFIRIYDKAAESKLASRDWKRYEIETKGMVARAMAQLLVNESDWDGAFSTMARGMLDVPASKDYQKFFNPDGATIGIPKLEKSSDREKWILEQCLPAIVKHYSENRISSAVQALRRALDFIDMKDTLEANG